MAAAVLVPIPEMVGNFGGLRFLIEMTFFVWFGLGYQLKLFFAPLLVSLSQ